MVSILLGTTYSCVGVWEIDYFETIAKDQDNPTKPPYVALYDTNRLFGRKLSEQVVQQDMMHLSPKVGPGNKPTISVHFCGRGMMIDEEEVSSMVRVKMMEVAKEYFGKDIVSVGDTLPFKV